LYELAARERVAAVGGAQIAIITERAVCRMSTASQGIACVVGAGESIVAIQRGTVAAGTRTEVIDGTGGPVVTRGVLLSRLSGTGSGNGVAGIDRTIVVVIAVAYLPGLALVIGGTDLTDGADVAVLAQGTLWQPGGDATFILYANNPSCAGGQVAFHGVSADTVAQETVVVDCAFVAVLTNSFSEGLVLYFTFDAEILGARILIVQIEWRARIAHTSRARVAFRAIILAK